MRDAVMFTDQSLSYQGETLRFMSILLWFSTSLQRDFLEFIPYRRKAITLTGLGIPDLMKPDALADFCES